MLLHVNGQTSTSSESVIFSDDGSLDVQVLGLTVVKMMIKSSREQVIDHHAAVAAAVVVVGHEMVKLWGMMVSDLVRKKAKNRM